MNLRFLISLSVLAIGCQPALSPAFRRESAQRLVVGLQVQTPPSAEHPSGETLHGSGILVGDDGGGKLYAITAKHLLPSCSASSTTDCAHVIVDKSALWPEREPEDMKVSVLAVAPGDIDFAVLAVASGSSRIPYWALLANDQDNARNVVVIGHEHGLRKPSFARATLEWAHGDEPDTFTMVPSHVAGSEAPERGDSGGGVFDEDWRLLGMHLGASASEHSYRMDRMIEWLHAGSFGTRVPVELAPAFEPSPLLGWPLDFAGGILLAGGIGSGLWSFAERKAYYDHPTNGGISEVATLNGVADGLLVAGAAVFVYQVVRLVTSGCYEKRAYNAWSR
jgi:hypothetical protein